KNRRSTATISATASAVPLSIPLNSAAVLTRSRRRIQTKRIQGRRIARKNWTGTASDRPALARCLGRLRAETYRCRTTPGLRAPADPKRDRAASAPSSRADHESCYDNHRSAIGELLLIVCLRRLCLLADRHAEFSLQAHDFSLVVGVAAVASLDES